MVHYHCNDVLINMRSIMEYIGCWPVGKPTVFSKMKKLLTYVFITSFEAMLILEVFLIFNDYFAVMEVLNWFFPTNGVVIKIYLLIINRRQFSELIEYGNCEIFNEGFSDRGKTISPCFNRAIAVGKALKYIAIFAMISTTTLPFIDGTKYIIDFPISVGRYWIIVYFYQLMSLGLASIAVLGFDTSFVSFTTIAAGQIEILKYKLASITANISLDEDTTLEMSSKCRSVHQIKIGKELRKCIVYYNVIEKYNLFKTLEAYSYIEFLGLSAS